MAVELKIGSCWRYRNGNETAAWEVGNAYVGKGFGPGLGLGSGLRMGWSLVRAGTG